MKKITDYQLKRWSAHMYISREIAWCTRYLADADHGYPNGLTPLKWKKILLKISLAFRDYFDRDGDFYEWKNGKAPKTRWFTNKDGRMEMCPTPKGYKLIINKKKQKAFKEAQSLLFRYFDSLWD
jgi:hypothetical protein